MVPRKRNKGKERKAKKEENKKKQKGVVGRWVRFHWCTVEIPDSLDHPVVSFLDEYFTTGDWWKSLKSHAKLWNNEDIRNIKQIFC